MNDNRCIKCDHYCGWAQLYCYQIGKALENSDWNPHVDFCSRWANKKKLGEENDG